MKKYEDVWECTSCHTKYTKVPEKGSCPECMFMGLVKIKEEIEEFDFEDFKTNPKYR